MAPHPDARELQAHCRACPLAATRSTVALPRGPDHSALFVLDDLTDWDTSQPPHILSLRQSVSQLLHERGFPAGTYATGSCVACDTPGNRRPSRHELLACSSWLRVALTQLYSPRVVLCVGQTASCIFYHVSTLSLAIQRAAKQSFVPDLAWARGSHIQVVPCPQISSLSAQRRGTGGKSWIEVTTNQLEIAIALSKDSDA